MLDIKERRSINWVRVIENCKHDILRPCASLFQRNDAVAATVKETKPIKCDIVRALRENNAMQFAFVAPETVQ